MNHYTYRITNTTTHKHYYGTRTSKISPSLDIGYIYFSSSTDKDFIQDQKENPQNYKYKVIKIFSTRKEAIDLEIKLHDKFDVGINEKFYNRAKQKSSGFDVTGNRLIGEQMSKTRIQLKLAQGKNNGMYGREHTTETKKKMSLSKIGTSFSEEVNKSKGRGGSEHAMYGKTHTEEVKKRLSDGMIGKFGGSKNIKAKRIEIYNADGCVEYKSNGSFDKVCIDNKLPLKVSYQNDGKKIYQTKRSLGIANKMGFNQFIGWYAKVV